MKKKSDEKKKNFIFAIWIFEKKQPYLRSKQLLLAKSKSICIFSFCVSVITNGHYIKNDKTSFILTWSLKEDSVYKPAGRYTTVTSEGFQLQVKTHFPEFLRMFYDSSNKKFCLDFCWALALYCSVPLKMTVNNRSAYKNQVW